MAQIVTYKPGGFDGTAGSIATTDTVPDDPAKVGAATIRQNVVTNLATLQTWLANNPNGAVLTAGQTKVLANILIGISKLLLQDTASTTGT